MFCPRCGQHNRDDARFCRFCAASLTAAPAEAIMMRGSKSPGLAAVLSFFICGLGQIYNGQILKGVVTLVLYSFSVFLIHVVIGIITTPLLWLWGIVDAYRVAERINRGEL